MSESKEVEKGPAVSETEIDKSFYKVVLAERNLAWHQLEQAKVTIANLEERLAHQTDRTHNVEAYNKNIIKAYKKRLKKADRVIDAAERLVSEGDVEPFLTLL